MPRSSHRAGRWAAPDGPGDANANWVTTSWPPETQTILHYQWEEVLLPFWRELVAYARGHAVSKLCLELHGHQNVYSAGTFFRLRDAVGETVGVNFDPSHLLWMGADPLAAIAALGRSIYHVHAKDPRLEPEALARDDVLAYTVPLFRPLGRPDRLREGKQPLSPFWDRSRSGVVSEWSQEPTFEAPLPNGLS